MHLLDTSAYARKLVRKTNHINVRCQKRIVYLTNILHRLCMPMGQNKRINNIFYCNISSLEKKMWRKFKQLHTSSIYENENKTKTTVKGLQKYYTLSGLFVLSVELYSLLESFFFWQHYAIKETLVSSSITLNYYWQCKHTVMILCIYTQQVLITLRQLIVYLIIGLAIEHGHPLA